MIAQKHNLLFVSVSDLLREECRRRGLPVERQYLRKVSAEWRREFGLGVLVDKAIEAMKMSGKAYNGVVASPMRNVGEAQHLKDLSGTLVWVDADPRIRYERIQSTHRGRDGEDNKTYEEFRQEEKDEMYPPDPNDPSLLNGAGVKAMADVTILNETNLIDLEKAIAQALL